MDTGAIWVFEGRRARRAQKRYSREYAEWQAAVGAVQEALTMAREYEGNVESPCGVILKPGERVFASITGASLIEERSAGGSWQGRSSGVSVPVGFGVRYRAGASRGHYVKAPPVPTAIDQGLFVITNQRASFQGTRQTRGCPFNRLLGFSYDPDNGGITMSVSNRQKPTRVRFGPDLGPWFSFRFELALARFKGSHAQFVAGLDAQLADLQAKQPVPPVTEHQVIPPPQNQPALPQEHGANDAYGAWVGDWTNAYFAWVAEQGIELDPESPRADFEHPRDMAPRHSQAHPGDRGREAVSDG